MISPATPSACSRTRTPTVSQVPSTGNAISSGCPALSSNAAGANPSRNLALAASENGPRTGKMNLFTAPA
jgi:hypothetical protein